MVKLVIYYWDNEIKLMRIDSSQWKELAPENILKIWWTHDNGKLWTNVKGWAIYCFKDNKFFGIHQTDALEGFKEKTTVDLVNVLPTLPSWARHGFEVSDLIWLRVEQLKP